MKQYIVVDDRFKIGQYLLGIAKSLTPNNKSIKIISKEELDAEKQLYNKKFINKIKQSEKEIENGDYIQLKSKKDIKKLIWE